MAGWTRNARGAFVAALLVATATARAQSGYPDRPIRVIVPLAAASAVDAAARILTQKMATNMHASFVIENIDGASGQIGANRVAKAAPDGYTIGAFNDSIMTMLPNIQPNLPWDILKDFTPITLAAIIDWGLIVAPNAPYATVADVIAAAKANPGKINYGSGGIGSPQHIAMALFMSQAGIAMNHVPYKGATQDALGVAAGDTAMSFIGLATTTSLVAGKRLRLVAVSTKARLPIYPDVPTISEAGLPGFQFESWVTLMAPAGTPKAIVERLRAEVVKALQDPEVVAQLRAQALSPRGSTPDELGAATRVQLERYRKAIADAGIKAQ